MRVFLWRYQKIFLIVFNGAQLRTISFSRSCNRSHAVSCAINARKANENYVRTCVKVTRQWKSTITGHHCLSVHHQEPITENVANQKTAKQLDV